MKYEIEVNGQRHVLTQAANGRLDLPAGLVVKPDAEFTIHAIREDGDDPFATANMPAVSGITMRLKGF